MSSNLADQSPPGLTTSGQDEFKFGRSTPRSDHQIYLSILTSSGKVSTNLADLLLHLPPDLPSLVLTSSGEDEFKFGISTPRSATRYPYLPILTSSGKGEYKFGRSTPRSATRSTSPQYCHLVIKMSSNLADPPPGTDIQWSRWVQIWQIDPPVLTSSGQDGFKFGRSTHNSNI